MPIDYLPILILVVVATAFACLALIVPTLLGPRKPTKTKLLPYESGKIPFGNARRRFPVKYYLTAMLFIVLNVDYISHKLGIKVGQTTPDGEFTLPTAECLGSCGTAPMMQVDETYYENLTEEKIDQILAELA